MCRVSVSGDDAAVRAHRVACGSSRDDGLTVRIGDVHRNALLCGHTMGHHDDLRDAMLRADRGLNGDWSGRQVHVGCLLESLHPAEGGGWGGAGVVGVGEVISPHSC